MILLLITDASKAAFSFDCFFLSCFLGLWAVFCGSGLLVVYSFRLFFISLCACLVLFFVLVCLCAFFLWFRGFSVFNRRQYRSKKEFTACYSSSSAMVSTIRSECRLLLMQFTIFPRFFVYSMFVACSQLFLS